MEGCKVKSGIIEIALYSVLNCFLLSLKSLSKEVVDAMCGGPNEKKNVLSIKL